jgi:glycosyltransferase involved in cell wall biosynthesis
MAGPDRRRGGRRCRGNVFPGGAGAVFCRLTGGASEDEMVNSPRNRRILFVLGSLTMGGTETQLVLLAGGLKRRGWDVDVFPLEKPGVLVDQLERAGVQVWDGGYRHASGTRIGRLTRLLACEGRLLWRVLRSRPDVVHGFLPLTNFMTAVTGRLTFAPRIVTSKRALSRHQDRHPAWKRLDWIANTLSDVVTANSKAVAADTHARDGYDLKRIVVIPNGVDFSRLDQADRHRGEARAQLGLSSTDIAVGMVANLIPYKGHRELLEAFARIAAGDVRPRLFLIGRDDGIGTSLIADAARLGIADRVNWMGQRSDVPVLLSAMDLGVMASHEEGFSNALLEKLAIGLPVVATDVGGNPEALQDMPDCILVRPQDADDLARGLGDAIGRLDRDGQEARKVRQRLVRERYSIDAMVDAYERLYRGSR